MTGVVGLLACTAALALAFLAPTALHGWLAAALFWTALPIGGLFLLLLVRLVPGGWRNDVGPASEALVVLLPIVVLALLPLVIAPGVTYPWIAETQEGLRGIYLTRGFFVTRTVLFVAGMAALGFLLLLRPRWWRPAAAGGLIVFTLFDGLIAVDWIMSLDPHFRSSTFGLYILCIQATIALCVVILIAERRAERVGILGALLLTALLFWVYFAFMQYLIVWSGNLPEGAAWYLRRQGGIWTALGWFIATLHAVPLLLLMLPRVRHCRRWLPVLAVEVLVGKACEAAWLVLPEAKEAGFLTVVATALAIAGLGAVTVAALMPAWNWRRREAAS